jgi:hypothetical protein
LSDFEDWVPWEGHNPKALKKLQEKVRVLITLHLGSTLFKIFPSGIKFTLPAIFVRNWNKIFKF